MIAEDLPEDIPEEVDESPLALSLHYPNTSAHGAGQAFSILALSNQTITERNADGINVLNASDYRALSSVRPVICLQKVILENGSGRPTRTSRS